MASASHISPDRAAALCYTIYTRELVDEPLLRRAVKLPHLDSTDLRRLALTLRPVLMLNQTTKAHVWVEDIVVALLTHSAADEAVALVVAENSRYTLSTFLAQQGWLAPMAARIRMNQSSAEVLEWTAKLTLMLSVQPRAQKLVALLGLEWDFYSWSAQDLAGLAIELAGAADVYAIPDEVEGYDLLTALATAPLSEYYRSRLLSVFAVWGDPEQSVFAAVAARTDLTPDEVSLLVHAHAQMFYVRWTEVEQPLLHNPLFTPAHAMEWLAELNGDVTDIVQLCRERRWSPPLVMALVALVAGRSFDSESEAIPTYAALMGELDPLLAGEPVAVWDVALSLASSWNCAQLPELLATARGILTTVSSPALTSV